MSAHVSGPAPAEGSRRPGPPAATLAFPALAVLALGGFAAALGLVRYLSPETFRWAPSLLDRRVGLATAAVMAAAAASALAAVRLAASRKSGGASAFLAATLVLGCAGLTAAAASIPAAGRRAGLATSAPRAAAPRGGPSPAATAHVGDAVHGRQIFLGTCAACHGPDGTGRPSQGANLRDSAFVRAKTDAELLAFVKVGRQPFDPDSKLHLAMPARGGNPALSDADLSDAIAEVRELQKAGAAATAAASPKAPPPQPKAQSPAGAPSDQPEIVDGALFLPHSVIPAAAAGPPGVAADVVALQKPGAVERSVRIVRRFFTLVLLGKTLEIFFIGTGLFLGIATVSLRRDPLQLGVTAGYWLIVACLVLLIEPQFLLRG